MNEVKSGSPVAANPGKSREGWEGEENRQIWDTFQRWRYKDLLPKVFTILRDMCLICENFLKGHKPTISLSIFISL